MSATPDRRDVAMGVAVSALRAAVGAGRLATAPARLASRAPLVGGPMRRAAAMLEAEGRRERLLLEARAERVVEQAVVAGLDSRLVLALTDRIIRSAEMQHAIEHLASTPELRRAIAEQSTGMAEEMVGGIRRRSESIDESAERTVRRWLRRS